MKSGFKVINFLCFVLENNLKFHKQATKNVSFNSATLFAMFVREKLQFFLIVAR